MTDSRALKTFESEFLANYLKVGIGALTKKDVDALVMYLLDKYGLNGTPPLWQYRNQQVSVLLKAPVSKVKQLRYEAGLKYGDGRVEDKAMARLLVSLSDAVFEIESNRIYMIIEDGLTKNWLQGQLKINKHIFDHSFNTEIIKVDYKGLFEVLDEFFDSKLTLKFKSDLEKAIKNKKGEELNSTFVDLAKTFAAAAAKKAGASVAAYFGCYIPAP